MSTDAGTPTPRTDDLLARLSKPLPAVETQSDPYVFVERKECVKDLNLRYEAATRINQLESELTTLRTAHEAAQAELIRLNHWQENYANETQQKLDAAQSQIRALLKLSGNRLADYTKAQAEIAALRKSELRWKRMAEFQYGRRAYPDNIELAQGALDEFYKTNFDGKDAIDAARGKS